MDKTADPARLLIADVPEIGEGCAAILVQAGHRADTAATAAETLDKVIATNDYDMLLADARLRFGDGTSLLERVKRVRPSLLIVVVANSPSVQGVLGAFRNGAYDFLEKPVSPEILLDLASRAVALRKMGGERRKLAEDLQRERQRVKQLQDRIVPSNPTRRIVGHSPAVQRLIDTICEVARTDSTVLLTGESGTGKGLVARTIHELSARGDGPFVEASCTVYAEGVLHSELFGHEKGAFTGADRTKQGRLELARGGTLFLDEIGDISPATQLLLLRVLQDRTFERVGGERTLEAEVRLVAATNRDLQEAMRQGAFREDLFYRLNVIPVHLPPLRDCPEDVPLLAQHFLGGFTARLGREIDGFTAESMDALGRYHWPGNTRELENMVERIVVLNRSGKVELQDLPIELRRPPRKSPPASGPDTLRSMERRQIIEALRAADGNKKKAARSLGIHRSSLYAKMRRHGLFEAPEVDRAERRDEREGPAEAAAPTSACRKA